MIERHELDLIVESIAKAVSPLIKRLEALEEKEPVAKDATELRSIVAPMIDDLVSSSVRGWSDGWKKLISTEVSAAIDSLPKPVNGDPGPRGESIKGDPGERGQDGKDCDMEALRRMIDEAAAAKEENIRNVLSKEIADTFAVLPVPKEGERGKDGKDGESVHPDTVSLMVLKAVQEAVAGVVLPKNGQDGKDGRDALQIDPMPAIDETRSFPRGTYAHYKGSLVRAVRNTEPGEPLKSGWEIVVEGFTPLEIKPADDGRTVTFIQRMMSGTATEKAVTFPVIIYRGTFKSGSSYDPGDFVTYDNQLWHCNEGTADTPGLSKSWQLAVRKPRDGKDGKGEKGDKGDKGDKGLDFRYQ